jgi:thiol-disulfide isomerase/thioredoxin
MRKLLGLALFAPVWVLAAGCETRKRELPTKHVEPVPVAIREADYRALDAALAAHEGDVILVDFWATWCLPCRKRFPHLVETHKRYAGNGLVCMSVSMDEQKDREAALSFLQKHGATFENFLLVEAGRDAERIITRFGYNNSIPFLALFDKKGKRVWDSGKSDRTDHELDDLIETELAK